MTTTNDETQITQMLPPPEAQPTTEGASDDDKPNGDYACDQCEKSFTTPQGLALHKSRSHGTPGSSRRSQSRSRSRSVKRTPDGERPPLNHDKLIKLVFPDNNVTLSAVGLRRLLAWLDEADALYEGR